jgi:hypothetical protein
MVTPPDAATSRGIFFGFSGLIPFGASERQRPTLALDQTGYPPRAMEEHHNYWLWIGATLIGLAIACLGVAGGLDAAREHYPFWTSPPMVIAYAFAALATFCFVAAIRDVPFPGAKVPEVSNRAAPVQTAMPPVGNLTPESLSQLRQRDSARRLDEQSGEEEESANTEEPAAPPRSTIVIERDAAVLRVRGPRGLLAHSRAECEVTAPSGTRYRAGASFEVARTRFGKLDWNAVRWATLRYPDHFPHAPALRKGKYQVHWEIDRTTRISPLASPLVIDKEFEI